MLVLHITPKDIDRAVAENIISREQAGRLWIFWNDRDTTVARFELSHVAYYCGALLVISAMGWFMNNAWESFGGMGMFVIALIYAVCFVIVGQVLWDKQGLRIPAGLMIVMAVCMTPLAIYGLERLWGAWPQGYPGHYRDFYHWVRGGWFWMEIGTLISVCLALRFFSFPFLTAPLAFSLYFLSMDITPLIFGTGYYWRDARWVSLMFGLVMIVASVVIDYRSRIRGYTGDYAFWVCLFGIVTFWTGLTLLDSRSEWSKLGYCLINIILMVSSVLLQRKVFLVFGAMGVFGYIGHLAYRVFQNSVLFPLALSLTGILIIYAGILYNKNQVTINRRIIALVPQKLRQFLPE